MAMPEDWQRGQINVVWILAFALLITAQGAMADAAAGEKEFEIVRHVPPHPLVALFADGGRVLARLAAPRGPVVRALTMRDGILSLRPMPDYRKATPRSHPDMLPDGIVTKGHGDITAAWLTSPTRRYDHGVLGDAVEASGLRVRNRAGRTLSFTLPKDSVFEDRRVRLADLNGDGGDELLVVRSYLTAGAALAVLRPGADGLALVAETAPIGLPHRWLNPAAVADFDGDGDLDLFVGGRVLPGRWPLPASSHLFENQEGNLIDVTVELAPDLFDLGLATGAVWTDVDYDGDVDLAVATE